MDKLIAQAERLKYFETNQLDEKIKIFGSACKVLRDHWNKTKEDLSAAMPREYNRISVGTIGCLENKNHPYGRDTFPTQISLCNLLAGLYLLDQKQPPEKQQLQKSDNLAHLAATMQCDPQKISIVYSHALKVQIDRALKDIIDAAARVENTPQTLRKDSSER